MMVMIVMIVIIVIFVIMFRFVSIWVLQTAFGRTNELIMPKKLMTWVISLILE